jgi:hypothetical protein
MATVRQRLEDILAESEAEEERGEGWLHEESESKEPGEHVDIEEEEEEEDEEEEEIPAALRGPEFRPDVPECLKCFRKLKKMRINCGADCDYEGAREKIDRKIEQEQRKGNIHESLDLERCKTLLIDNKCMAFLQSQQQRPSEELDVLSEFNLDYNEEAVRNECRECYIKMRGMGVDCGPNCTEDERFRAHLKMNKLIQQGYQGIERCRDLLIGERCMEKIKDWEELLELQAQEAMLDLEPEEAVVPEEKGRERVRVKANRFLVDFITHNLYLPCIHIEADREISTYPIGFSKKVKKLAVKNNIGVDGGGISALWAYVSYLTFQLVVGFSENPDPAHISAMIKAIKQHVTEDTESCRKPLRSLYREDERAPYIKDLELNCARLALMNLLVRLKTLQAEYINSPFLSKQDFVTALDIIVSKGRAPDFESIETDYTPVLFSDLERLYTRSVAENFAGLATGAVDLLGRLMGENDTVRNRIHFFAN